MEYESYGCDTCGSRIVGTVYTHSIGSALCKSCYLMLFRPSDVEVTTSTKTTKEVSDGSSTNYFKLPDHATELRHAISHKNMSFSRGNLFKACYRLGDKDGTSVLYDLNKMEFFLQDLREMLERGEDL
jgi:hypothetical protein